VRRRLLLRLRCGYGGFRVIDAFHDGLGSVRRLVILEYTRTRALLAGSELSGGPLLQSG
jgi:hypothetical protein